MTLIGYARVSTHEQDLALQLDVLGHAGCDRIFEDLGVSGAKTKRLGLGQTLVYVREGQGTNYQRQTTSSVLSNDKL